jgi:hypothetical protein
MAGIEESDEHHSKEAENTRPKTLSQEVSGRRKKNAFKLVGTSSKLHIDSNTLQSDVSEGLTKIGQELRAPAPMAGHPKKFQKRPILEASGGRSRDAFKLVGTSSSLQICSYTYFVKV